MFSVLVLTTGTVFLLILLPFTFIQFFCGPWLEARDRARAARELPDDMSSHVLLTLVTRDAGRGERPPNAA
jgi:hypothetical protein